MTILSPRTASEIIGRQPELAAVEAFLDRPAEGLTALVLEGEAGIGKSTLWLAGVAAARARSFVVLTSRPAETERMLPNVVLGDLFGDLNPTLLDGLPLPRRRAFEAALLLGGQPEAPVDPRTVGLAILTLIPLLASGRPVVLAIDDDQWLDLSSDATLRFVLRRLGTQPLRLLLSRRTPPGPAPALEDAIDSSAVERLAIGPLSVGAIQLLLRRGLGVSLSRPNLLRLHEVSAGNPFYALELARTIAVEPARGANEPLIVPSSLERLIGTRLDALAPGTRRPLLLIAAHGRFPAAMLPAVDLSIETLHQAIAGRVLEERGGVIRFSHPLLASTVYQAASAAERRAVHRQLAGIVADDVQRARHIALGADEASEETAAALESAADVARDRGLPLAAAELAEHAARLTPANAFDDRHRRMIAAGLAHLRGGDRASALAIATDLLAASPSGAHRAEALMLRAELEPPGPAIPLLEQALAESTGAAELEAAIHARLTIVGRFVHGGEWAEPHGRALLQLAERLDDDVLRTTALVTLALREFDGADPRGLPRAEEAYRLAISIGDPATLKLSMLALAYIHSWSGRTAQARAWLEHQITEWRDRDERARAELLWSLGFVDVASGRWSEAEECAREAFEINDAYEPEPGDHLLPALVALHRGQFAVARERALLGLQRPEREFLEDFHAVLGTCEAWSGRPETALDHSRGRAHCRGARLA